MKSPSPVLSHIKIQPLICLELFWLESGDFSQDSEEITFPLETTLWIMDSYFSQKQWFEVKTTDLFLTNTQLLSSRDVNWWSGVDYCDVFISCLDSFWRHPFTVEHPLVSKWYISPNLFCWRNKLLFVLGDLRVNTFSGIFHFWVNYPS